MYVHGRKRGFVRGRYKQLRYVNARNGGGGDNDDDKENFIIKTVWFNVKHDETDFEHDEPNVHGTKTRRFRRKRWTEIPDRIVENYKDGPRKKHIE